MTSPASETPARDSAIQSPPAVLTAGQRHELARQFEQAKQLAKKSPPDFRGVHGVFSEICTLDPGNTHFVAALLENLQTAQGKTASAWFWQVWKLRLELEKAIQEKQWTKALRAGWSLLGEVPEDGQVLRQLAEICATLEHAPTQIILLRAARKLEPFTLVTLRPLAIALSETGQFAESAEVWQQLQKVVPFDPEAEAYLQILLPRKKPMFAKDQLVERIQSLVQAKMWDEAEQLMAAQAATAGIDLDLRWMGEHIVVGRAQERTEIARQLAEFRPSAASEQLVRELLNEQRRIELGVAYARYERFPSEPKSLQDLAECLKGVGNYSEALKYLEQLQKHAGWEAPALVGKAENWQRLRQFERALACYREAIARPDFLLEKLPYSQFELALFQGSNLATAMGDFQAAMAWLERVVEADPEHEEAAARLDNLRVICHKGGFPAGRPSHGE